jgi:hypothetical protein
MLEKNLAGVCRLRLQRLQELRISIRARGCVICPWCGAPHVTRQAPLVDRGAERIQVVFELFIHHGLRPGGGQVVEMVETLAFAFR